MSRRRTLILCHPKSLVHARPGDLVLTDIWEVFETAKRFGLSTYDIREILSGAEDLIDNTVMDWRSVIDHAKRFRIEGVAVLPSLRTEIVWEVLMPFARYATAAKAVRDTALIATDLEKGGSRRMAIEAVLGADVVFSLPKVPRRINGSTESVEDLLLPPSHAPVVFEGAAISRATSVAASWKRRTKELLIPVATNAVSTVMQRLTRRAGRQRYVVYGHYKTLGDIWCQLGSRYTLVAWPWAYLKIEDRLRLAAKGAVVIPFRRWRSVKDLPERHALGKKGPTSIERSRSPIDSSASITATIGDQIAEALGENRFYLGDRDVTPWLTQLITGVVRKYLHPLYFRIQAAKKVVEKIGVQCAIVPSDTTMDLAPLATVASDNDVPVVVVAHGIEGSQVIGDKMLASDALVWSEQMAEGLRKATTDTREIVPRIWVTGPPHLATLTRTSPPNRASVLFLSYAVRHNTAWDSWMDAEKYIRILSDTLARLGSRMRVVGLKIHPSEDASYYRSVMRSAGLEIPLLDTGSVPEVLDDAGLVVGPISTGLAEAFYLGSMPCCVNLCKGQLPAPCDGSTEIPIVTDSTSLSTLLTEWLSSSVWPEWTPEKWPKFSKFVGEFRGASRRCAEVVFRILGS